MQQVRAVVAKAKGEPVSIETVNVPDPLEKACLMSSEGRSQFSG